MTETSLLLPIVWLVRLLVWAVAFKKVIEILWFMIWLLRRGGAYRADLIASFSPSCHNSYHVSRLREIDLKHGYPWPLFWRIQDQYFPSQLSMNSFLRLLKGANRFMAQFVDREPLVVVALALFLAFLPHPIFSYVDGALVLAVIFTELADMLLARCILGFWDNFRLDFTFTVFSHVNDPRGLIPISRVQFLAKFMLGIAFFLSTAWFAFACLYYCAYVLGPPCVVGPPCPDSAAAFRNLLPGWQFPQFLYFSLVTLATVGFGDIVPNTLTSQMCVALEILLGFASIVFLFFTLSTTFTFDGDLDAPKPP